MTLAAVSQIEIPETTVVVGSWSDEHGVTFATARAEGPGRWIDWPGVGVFAFRIGSAAVKVAPVRPRAEVRDLFDRVLQPVVLQALGRQALHASAVWGPGGALAFCGRGRSGKSTLAFALTRQGFLQIADDALLIDAIDADVVVRALPFISQLREPSRQHFDGTQTGPHAVECTHPDVMPLQGVFVLSQEWASPPEPVVERLPAVSAFSILLQHAHCFDQRPSFHSQSLVEDYLRTIERVPVFTLRYAPSFSGLDALVRAVVAVAERLGVRPMQPSIEIAGE